LNAEIDRKDESIEVTKKNEEYALWKLSEGQEQIKSDKSKVESAKSSLKVFDENRDEIQAQMGWSDEKMEEEGDLLVRGVLSAQDNLRRSKQMLEKDSPILESQIDFSREERSAFEKEKSSLTTQRDNVDRQLGEDSQTVDSDIREIQKEISTSFETGVESLTTALSAELGEIGKQIAIKYVGEMRVHLDGNLSDNMTVEAMQATINKLQEELDKARRDIDNQGRSADGRAVLFR
jgi:predicted  nucleic acid-binding Zn-ribbon protein